MNSLVFFFILLLAVTTLPVEARFGDRIRQWAQNNPSLVATIKDLAEKLMHIHPIGATTHLAIKQMIKNNNNDSEADDSLMETLMTAEATDETAPDRSDLGGYLMQWAQNNPNTVVQLMRHPVATLQQLAKELAQNYPTLAALINQVINKPSETPVPAGSAHSSQVALDSTTSAPAHVRLRHRRV